MGLGWGLTQPLSKIVVNAGYKPLGVMFWQMSISVIVLGAVRLAQGGQPLARRNWGSAPWQVYLVIAAVGTLIPQYFSYTALAVLPAGLVSILIALVPMFAFPIALAMGLEGFKARRLIGLTCGAIGVLLIVGPEASLPEAAMLAFVPLALVAPAFYGLEGNLVSKMGLGDLDPVQALFGASLFGAGVLLPASLATGQWVLPTGLLHAPQDQALLATGLIHAVVYTCYVWMVGKAGSVFAAQVSYIVTGSGVMWSILLLGESYSGYIWAALVVMFAGLFFVQPRPWRPENSPLAHDQQASDTLP